MSGKSVSPVIMADPVKDGFDELDSLAVDSALDDELAKLKANNKK